MNISPKSHVGPEGEASMTPGRQQTSEKKYVSELMKIAGYDRVEAAQMYDAIVSGIEPYFYYDMQLRETSNGFNTNEENTVIMSNEEIKNLTKEFPLMRVLDYYGVGDVEEYEVCKPGIIQNLDSIFSNYPNKQELILAFQFRLPRNNE